ncbi:hypothetical protein N9L49_01640 [Rhodospirillales bacterium]|nr:hypothetical protein [Rhodospirillales bacterium]
MSNEDLRSHRHFVSEVEQAIRLANHEVLNPIVSPLTEEKVISVAVHVAQRRAAYLSAALDLAKSEDEQPSGDKLRTLRREYEESRDAFAELMTTIERGYVDLPKS